MSENFFQKVATRADRERVYTLLLEQKLPLLVQLPDKTIVKLKPKSIRGTTLIIESAGDTFEFKDDVVLSFSIGTEKYFVKTKLSEGASRDWAFDITVDLYKLQRRESFRLNIPPGYNARVDLNKIADKTVKMRYSIVDLSGGGCAFEITVTNDTQDIKRGDTIQGLLTVGPTFSTSFVAIVRYCRSVGSQGSGLKRVGVEFENLSPSSQQEVLKLVMQLHRDMFSKFKLAE